MKKIFKLEFKGVKFEADEEVVYLSLLKYGFDLEISVKSIKRLYKMINGKCNNEVK